MGKVLKVIALFRASHLSAMFVTITLLFIASIVVAQDQENLINSHPAQFPGPFMDLFAGASTNSDRRVYADPYGACPRSDPLASVASILGSAAKILMSGALLVFLKILGMKIMLFPLAGMLLMKLGLKAFLLWPMISKLIKFLRKKKKYHKSRTINDCSERIACVIQKTASSGMEGHFGSALTFSLIDDYENNPAFAKALLAIFAGEDVSKCMSLECSSGLDVS